MQTTVPLLWRRLTINARITINRLLPRFALLLISTALITACTQPRKHAPTITSENLQQIQALNKWQAKGKLNLLFEGRSRSANFHWQHSEDNYDIRLHGLLGLGGGSLIKHGNTVLLKTNNRVLSDASPESLLQRSFGWSVPVSELADWIKGLPSSTSPIDQLELGEMGEVRAFEQQGWKIRYVRYIEQQGLALPSKIIATREDIKLTLIVKQWDIEPTPLKTSAPLVSGDPDNH